MAIKQAYYSDLPENYFEITLTSKMEFYNLIKVEKLINNMSA